MFELSLHILDLVQNSIRAGAKLVRIIVRYDDANDLLTITIADDGCGMDAALLARVTSPFGTTRTTRKVGLGISMFKALSQGCGGTFHIASQPGVGTTLTATFQASHVDLAPLGDLAGTMRTLIAGAPDTPDFLLEYQKGDISFVLDTRQMRQMLDGVPLNEPEILAWIGEYVQAGLAGESE